MTSVNSVNGKMVTKEYCPPKPAKTPAKNTPIQTDYKPERITKAIINQQGTLAIGTGIKDALDSGAWVTISPDGSGTYQTCWMQKPIQYAPGTFSHIYDEASKNVQENKIKGGFSNEDAQKYLDMFEQTTAELLAKEPKKVAEE